MQITLDEGFQFGLGLFETIAVEKGEPLLLDAHLRRLEKSMAFLDLRQSLTEKDILEYLLEHPMERGVLKVMISRENRVFTTRTNPYTTQRYQRGFCVDYSEVKRNETSPFVFHKTMNYGDCILEKRKAAAQGMDELIFLNTRGEICEGTAVNIFFVKDGQIETPELSCGILPGVMREYVCGRRQVEEKCIYPSDVEGYEECFVTNSLMGMMPVMRFGTKQFEKRDTADALMREYRERILHRNSKKEK